MSQPIALGGIHHVALTVTDVPRALDFYTHMLGFQVLVERPTKTIMTNGSTILLINGPYDPTQMPANDRFTEHRTGLDHVSFTVSSRADLENAVQVFDANNVPHGEIKDLRPAGLPLYVLAFRDPDNIQLELTAPVG
jgi:glyoxylase I family protein